MHFYPEQCQIIRCSEQKQAMMRGTFMAIASDPWGAGICKPCTEETT